MCKSILQDASVGCARRIRRPRSKLMLRLLHFGQRGSHVAPQIEARVMTPEASPLCRDAVEVLLNMNARTTIANKNQQTPPDLAIPQSDVWELLHEEAEWRSLLETHRPCRVRLVSAHAAFII